MTAETKRNDYAIGAIVGTAVAAGIWILFCPPFSLFWRFIIMLAGK